MPRAGPERETTTHRDARDQRFYALVDSVPRGKVASYGQIAKEAGLPRHARHVGAALRRLPSGTTLAWHRIVNGRGEIAVRSGGWHTLQRKRLRAEGVRLDGKGRIDLERFGWEPQW